MCRNGKAERLSLDHKGSDKLERERIQSIGGFVTEKGRVMGDLAVSRSLGDVSCSPYVTSKPFVSEVLLNKEADFLIVACDGLFDVMEDQEACDVVNKFPKEKSSMVLRDFAYLLNSGDNVSVIVIHFKKNYFDASEIGRRRATGELSKSVSSDTKPRTQTWKSVLSSSVNLTPIVSQLSRSKTAKDSSTLSDNIIEDNTNIENNNHIFINNDNYNINNADNIIDNDNMNNDNIIIIIANDDNDNIIDNDDNNDENHLNNNYNSEDSDNNENNYENNKINIIAFNSDDDGDDDEDDGDNIDHNDDSSEDDEISNPIEGSCKSENIIIEESLQSDLSSIDFAKEHPNLNFEIEEQDKQDEFNAINTNETTSNSNLGDNFFIMCEESVDIIIESEIII